MGSAVQGAVCIAAALLVSLAPGVAAADEPPAPSAETRAAAAEKFREGEQAFRRGEFRQAAEAFAASHAISGHPSPLINEAIALEQAGEHARAANRYTTFLDRYPPDVPRRAEAERRRDGLAPALGVAETVAASVTELAVDGQPATPGQVFLDPGDHQVTARGAAGVIRRRLTLAAGQRIRVDLDAGAESPSPIAPAPAPAPPAPATPRADRDAGGGGLHPAWFFVGVGASVALGGLTAWSGVDTNDARTRYDNAPSRALYDEGTGKVTRTNVLLAASLVTAAATAAIGLFATDWGGARPATAAGPGPSGLVARF